MQRSRLLFLFSALLAVSSCVSIEKRLACYWDGYDFSSTAPLEKLSEAEEHFADYIVLLSKCDTLQAVRSIERFLDSASANEVSYLVYYDMFLSAYCPAESPYKDDVRLAYVLNKALKDGPIDQTQKQEAERLLRISRSCRPGDVAPFASALGVSGPMLVLVMDPSCRSCLDMMTRIENDPTADGLSLVAVSEHCFPGAAASLSSSHPRWTLVQAPGQMKEMCDLKQLATYYVIAADATVMVKASSVLPVNYKK